MRFVLFLCAVVAYVDAILWHLPISTFENIESCTFEFGIDFFMDNKIC